MNRLSVYEMNFFVEVGGGGRSKKTKVESGAGDG